MFSLGLCYYNMLELVRNSYSVQVFGAIFDDNTFTSGFDYVNPISVNNQSKTITIEFTSQQKHQYYFVTCSTQEMLCSRTKQQLSTLTTTTRILKQQW